MERRDTTDMSTMSGGEVTEDDVSFFSGEDEIIHTTGGRRARNRGSSDALPLSLPERKHKKKWRSRLVRSCPCTIKR